MDRNQCADVLAEHADIRGQASAGYFLAGENLDQLLFATGGVLGGEFDHLHGLVADGCTHGGNGFRLVVFDADQHLIRVQDMHQDLDPGDDFSCLVTHRSIVSGDIGLALCGIDNQGMNWPLTPGIELHCGGETRATHT